MRSVSYAPWGETMAELVNASVDAADAGFSRIWASESQRTPFVPLAATLGRRAGTPAGTCIALAFVRSPLTLAISALDLDDLTGGDLVLGLGAGVRRLNQRWHGRDFDPAVARLSEVIRIVRNVFEATHDRRPCDGSSDLLGVDLRGFTRAVASPRPGPPIYVAAVGRQMLELAGGVGDGWLSHELGSVAHYRSAVLPHLDAGARRAGRTARPRVVGAGCCVIDPDASAAKRVAAASVAFYATVKSFEPLFASHGFGDEARRIQDDFRRSGLEGLADHVPDDMVDAFAFAGTVDQVRQRMHAMSEVVDEIRLHPPRYADSAEVIRLYQHRILEELAP